MNQKIGAVSSIVNQLAVLGIFQVDSPAWIAAAVMEFRCCTCWEREIN